MIGILIVGVALVLGPSRLASAQDPEPPPTPAPVPPLPVPAGYHLEHRTRTGLLTTGVLLFVGSYLQSYGVAWAEAKGNIVLIPVVGPILAIGSSSGRDCGGRDIEYCSGISGLDPLLALGSVLQVASLFMVWRGLAGRELQVRDEPPKLTLGPGRVGRAGYGAWLTGHF